MMSGTMGNSRSGNTLLLLLLRRAMLVSRAMLMTMVLVVMVVLASLSALTSLGLGLCLGSLGCHLALHGLLAQLVEEIGDTHAGLLGCSGSQYFFAQSRPAESSPSIAICRRMAAICSGDGCIGLPSGPMIMGIGIAPGGGPPCGCWGCDMLASWTRLD